MILSTYAKMIWEDFVALLERHWPKLRKSVDIPCRDGRRYILLPNGCFIRVG